MRKVQRKPRMGALRRAIVDPDLDAAVDRACKELDAARNGGSKVALHHSVKVLRAVIIASEREDEERSWS